MDLVFAEPLVLRDRKDRYPRDRVLGARRDEGQLTEPIPDAQPERREHSKCTIETLLAGSGIGRVGPIPPIQQQAWATLPFGRSRLG
jgi:hypothetical protein